VKNIPEVYSDMENDPSQHARAYRATHDLVSEKRDVQACSPNVRDHYDQPTLDSISGLCGSIETIYFDGENINRFVTLKSSTEGVEIAEAPTSYYSIQNTDVSFERSSMSKLSRKFQMLLPKRDNRGNHRGV
jgi:hypothetical protein